MAKGFVIAAPASGTGKTSLTFGLLAALRRAGTAVQGFKVGPDYIDPHYHALAADRPCPNLDPWAMRPETLRAVLDASAAAEPPADLCVIEGVMGLFDGAASGGGSTADLARTLDLPVVLVLDVKGQSQSVAALVQGFARFDPSIRIAGLIFNRCGSARHEAMLRAAVAPLGIPVVGALPRLPALAWPSRHLGLSLPHDLPADGLDMAAQAALLAQRIGESFDLSALLALAETLPATKPAESEAEAAIQRGYFPAGAKVAIARDAAFAFTYPHWLSGTERFFSPLNNEAIPTGTDFVFLPGGYPELHAERLAQADTFWSSLRDHHSRGRAIYGECGGYMALGQAMTVNGQRYDMAGLLPVVTHFTDGAARTLGYRSLRAPEDFWLGPRLKGHEFHASSAECLTPPDLFHVEDSRHASLGLHGHKNGNTLGSYLHIIDRT